MKPNVTCFVKTDAERASDYRKRNPDKVKEYSKLYWSSHKEKSMAQVTAWRRKNKEKALLGYAKSRAKRKGIEFSLTEKDVVIPDVCPILGVPFSSKEGKGPCRESPTIDRKDPNVGYIPDNVWVISHRANSMKTNASKGDLVAFAKWVIKEHGSD